MTFKELAVGQVFKFPNAHGIWTKTTNDLSADQNAQQRGVKASSWVGSQVEVIGLPSIEDINPSQTPRTDAEYAIYQAKDGMVSLQFAKQLEQELAESLAREQKLRDDLEDIRTILGR